MCDNASKVHSNEEVRLKCAQNALKRELSVQEKMVIDFVVENGSTKYVYRAVIKKGETHMPKLTIVMGAVASGKTHFIKKIREEMEKFAQEVKGWTA